MRIPSGTSLRVLVRTILRSIGLLVFILGLVVAIVTFTPLVDRWARTLAGPWSEARGDILVVLSGSNLDPGLMGYSSYWRSVYAVRAYREGLCREILISGGGQSGRAISESMRDFLVGAGVPEYAIRVERRSRSTWESAHNVRDLLQGDPSRLVLLTSDYHMFRSHRMFRKAGLEPVPSPVPDAIKRATRWKLRWWAFLDLAEESAKILFHWAQGRI